MILKFLDYLIKMLSVLRTFFSTQTKELRESNDDQQGREISEADKNVLPIIDLPLDLFLLIKLYLTHKDFVRLINVNKHPHILAVKSHSVSYNLRGADSWRYFNNIERFQNNIDALLYARNKQLSLILGDQVGRTPSLNDLSKLSILCNLKHLTLRNVEADWELLSSLRNISKLRLEGFPNLASLPNYNDRGIEEIVIANFPLLIDVQNISKIAKISIIFCPMLVEVSPLRGCRELTLQSCVRLKDISMLGNQEKLSLSYCPSIVFSESLNHVKVLKIHECESIKDLSSLRGTEEVTLSLKFISALPVINHAKKLVLNGQDVASYNFSSSRFDSLEDVTISRFSGNLALLPKFNEEHLKTVTIELCGFRNLRSFHFTYLYQLELIEVWDFRDVSNLGHIPILYLCRLGQLIKLKGLGQATQKHVTIHGCSKVRDYSPLAQVPHVTILESSVDFEVNRLKYCQIIEIRNCPYLSNLKSALTINCSRFIIEGCPHFTSLSGLENVGEVEVTACGCKNERIKKWRTIKGGKRRKLLNK